MMTTATAWTAHPTPIVRTITLAESEGMPTLTALCTGDGWNNFHVPMVTLAEIRAYYAASAAADPNGIWDSVTWDVIPCTDPELLAEAFMRMHCCESAMCGVDPVTGETEHDHDEDYTWPIEGGTANLDGLTWIDPA